MDDFRQIIGKKIIDIYLEPLAIDNGIADTQIHSDFIYIGSGAMFIKTEADLYIIGSLHSTQLATDYLGIKERNDLLPNSLTWNQTINELSSFKNKLICGIQLNWNIEKWTNYGHNEKYLESITISFEKGHSLSIFVGDFESNEANNEINFLAGHSSIILFTNQDNFKKYKLNQGHETVNI
ncbi:MAG: hypothetical protein ACOZCO_17330 [Bacteroidota bacterium]